MNPNDRFLKPKFENIPEELKALPWAVWKAEPRAGQPGKFNKAPRSPKNGYRIGADKPNLFGTYVEAVAAYSCGYFTGVGVLLTGNGIVGVDIDDAKETLKNDQAIREWLKRAVSSGAYVERSPSNTGLRLFLEGETIKRGSKRGKLEIYHDLRFITVTGHLLKPQSIAGAK